MISYLLQIIQKFYTNIFTYKSIVLIDFKLRFFLQVYVLYGNVEMCKNHTQISMTEVSSSYQQADPVPYSRVAFANGIVRKGE